jgi:tRNA(Ile2) C34 agmatinyltransferase TiaS
MKIQPGQYDGKLILSLETLVEQVEKPKCHVCGGPTDHEGQMCEGCGQRLTDWQRMGTGV